MRLAKARKIAEDIRAILTPRCERIEIAGSIRREKPEVKDIELVAVPKMLATTDLFGSVEHSVNMLDTFPLALLGVPVKSGEKYKQIDLLAGINLDLFIVLPGVQDWGVIYTIRTGPAEFSHWCVTPRKLGGGLPSDCKVFGGRVYRATREAGCYLPMPEEIDFLNFLGLGWVEPKDRMPGWKKN